MRQRKSSKSKSKRKRKPKKAEALTPEPHQAAESDHPDGTIKKNTEEEEEEEDDNGGKKFYACYLLTSLSPRSKNFTYIGFTVNPRRRIRQHNGEIKNGASCTKARRPWAMAVCIYGFPTKVSALQFEWAWKHPRKSKAVREAAMSFKSFSGVANKIKLAYTMLGLPPWQRLSLTVNYFSTEYEDCCSSSGLPRSMKVRVCPVDELPCYSTGTSNNFLDDKEDGGGECGSGDARGGEGVGELSGVAAGNVVEGDGWNLQSSFRGEEQCENGAGMMQ